MVPLSALAATPRDIAEGKVWLLATSALVADRPWLPSMLGFVGVGLVALAVCGTAMTWATAALGHMVSTLLVYALVAAVGLVRPHAFQSVLTLSDYGLSAIIAVWLGAIASLEWKRRPAVGPRAAVAALCVLAALVGWLLRPDLTVLDLEHLVAFALGAALVRRAPAATARLAAQLRSKPAPIARSVRVSSWSGRAGL